MISNNTSVYDKCKDPILILFGVILSLTITIVAEEFKFRVEQRRNEKIVRESIYYRMKGIGEELENAYMTVEMTYMDFSNARLIEKLKSDASRLNRYTTTLNNYMKAQKEKSRIRGELSEVFGKIKLHFVSTPRMKEAMKKVIEAKSVGATLHAIVSDVPDANISAKLTKVSSSLEYERQRLDSISNVISANISDPINIISDEIKSQLETDSFNKDDHKDSKITKYFYILLKPIIYFAKVVRNAFQNLRQFSTYF